ncbi:MAG: BamA/TamA family outer membrane protein [Myxococcales bacterium]|nr:BamA/TamA family outer membrane protein [Myxococcales bacterium]USN49878.1 MAG: BamA/TamA family outer membrane protein [Myxococcales bacterium]
MKKKLFIQALCLMVSILVTTTAFAQENEKKIRFSGIPAFGFGADTGLGSGVIGNMYIDEEGYKPYQTSIGLKIYLTTKWVNSHALTFDRLKAFGLPWRLTGRLGFYSTPAQNYCGLGNQANCDEERAKIEANKLSLSEEKKEEFIRRYYENRFMSFFGEIFSRWILWQGDAKLELMTSYRGNYFLNRDFSEKGPYPNSLFDRDFKNKKIDGYLSTLELGLMLDSRDNEPAPTSGYWLESSIRGGASFIGSDWDYVAANLSARFYFPFDDERRFVFASQTIFDSIFYGTLPFEALSRVGGSQSISDYNAIGGQYLGRGIREQLYVGRLKAIEQIEFRYTFLSFNLFKQDFDLTGVALGDIGVTALDYKNLAKDLSDIHFGFGTGLRIHWNKTFVIRADLAMSPAENFTPRFYLVVGNVF